MAFSSSSSENNYGDRSYRDARVPGFGGSPEAGTASTSAPRAPKPEFDILRWYPKHQSCQRYFLDHAQHLPEVQAFASFINILLPFQREPNPIQSYSGGRRGSGLSNDWAPGPSSTKSSASVATVSLIPYIRRLVVCGMDIPPILQGFFGNDWAAGIGPQREQERRNYLFAAKSGGWAAVKRDYDMLPLETVPFMQPLKEPTDGELNAAEEKWSEWLALEDWMVGSRAPP
ncbi:uncharacterized protein HMPREF1541_10556 [Cyphellophora europaea CBS 101466]|uniref:Ilp is an apoptosis inhibitor n=1 Tax=Cyphellophora europaea (strain CBS 101466) TaxID=1220924 RepID=W2S6R1_CYPE1|nr:uncharacterized protein HMPREF1541_10556 [Cyphellophora europaea CBS 101466]ETN44376.1 hypothetical protein HMPREF1541_10556 [Cyphellophora europaea CBS 101466]